MNPDLPQNEQLLHAELERAKARRDELDAELHAVDAELESFAAERQQFETLDDVCASLEKLRELGGEELFWSGLAGGNFDSHVQVVRTRAADFGVQLERIDAQRKDVLTRISAGDEQAGLLEDDLDQLRQEAEQKKLEWLIERDDDSPLFGPSKMAWSHGGEDDARFRKSLGIAFLVSILFALIMPMIDIPVPDQWQVVQIPDRLTRLIKDEPEPLPEPIVQERLDPQKTQPELPDEPEKLAQDTTPKAAPTPKVSEVVASAGILALRDEFAGLASSDPASRLGTSARINRSGESAAGRRGRSLVTTQSANTSGGIDVNALGRDSVGGGGQSMEGVQVARATSSIGIGGGNDRPLSDGPGLSRTDEEIQIVFDRHKSALYRLYNRELRRDPTLRGQIVLKMVIEADGTVSLCEVRSSDMDAPALASKVVARVKLFDFGAKDGIPPISILYPIDFLPAA